MVLSNGRLTEHDSPAALLKKSSGVFAGMHSAMMTANTKGNDMVDTPAASPT